MKHSVIGGIVNVASRLEALNKDLGTDFLISRDLHIHLPRDLQDAVVDHDTHKVKGREHAVGVDPVAPSTAPIATSVVDP